MDQLLYGAAYYDEYMPYERLDKDISMMKKAGINVIRIAESTWSTEEPEEGVFDFSHVTKVLDACEKEGLYVIVGTPTYAIPAWMAKAYPEVMVTERQKALRCQADHGYHPSSLSILRGAHHPQTDGGG
jgi:beta-galactosidase